LRKIRQRAAERVPERNHAVVNAGTMRHVSRREVMEGRADMKLRSLAQGAAAAAVLFGTMAILDATPASARCRGNIVRGETAHGTLQTFTEISARSKWRSAVRARYGSTYTRWAVAEDKNVDCKKGEPGKRWHCRAVARPCDGRG